MDPATLALVSTVASAGGAVIGAVGAERQAQATSEANAYQAAVATNNQKIATQYAAAATQQGQIMAEEKQMQTNQQLGMVRAAVGASGMDPSSGTGMRLQKDTLAMGELDVNTIRANAAKTAYGYNVQGMSYGAQAGLDTAASANALASGNLAAMSSIISGDASVSNKWLQYQNAGITV